MMRWTRDEDRMASDRALAKRLLDGDEGAFEELFEDHVPRLYRVVLSRTHDHDVAEDLVQEALIRAMGKLHTYRAEASLLTWLTTFCLRETSAHYRKARRVPAISLSEEVPEIATALELLECGGGSPEREALASEIRRLVVATLDRLPRRYADALEWKYVDGLSVKEIAERWRTGPTAVQSVLGRARASFRDAFRSVGAAAGILALTQEGSTAEGSVAEQEA